MPRPKPAVIFIFVTLFLDVFGIGLIVPVLPDLVTGMQGGDKALASHSVGLLGSLYALMQFIFSPVLGSLSDRFGRRPVILASLFGSGLDYLLLAWAPTLWWLYVGRVVAGVTAANFTAASAYIVDVTPPEKRAAGFGMIGAAFGLGFIAGPMVGGLLGNMGLRVPFLVAAIVTLLNWLYGYFVLPESLAPENRRAFKWESAHPIKALMALNRWPLVMRLAWTHFLLNLAFTLYPSLWVLYTGVRYNWTHVDVGMSLAFVGVTTAIVQAGLAGKIIVALGDRRGLLVGLIATACAMAGYGLAPQGWVIYVMIAVGAFGGLATPSAQSAITKAVSPDEQGAVQGALNSLTSVAGILGPVLWTSIFSWSIADKRALAMPGLAFLVAAAVTLISLVLARWALAGQKGGPAAVAPPQEPPSPPPMAAA
ncbi:MAG: TCR/Tet family MFS transporter [Chthoniobacteraceae bacterium]